MVAEVVVMSIWDCMDNNKILQGDCLEVLKTLPDKSVDMCVTSPPYYGLRDYGTGEWVGGDPNCPHRRLSKQSDKTITGHAQDELKGNVGDAIYKTVCPLCGAVRVDRQIGLEESPEEYIDKLVHVFREVKRVLKDEGTLWLNIGDSYVSKPPSHRDNPNMQDKAYGNYESRLGYEQSSDKYKNLLKQYKNKDLIGIPWMLAFALRADGWYLRQDIIWHKPNPMPESVKDRFTKSHEYVFLLSKKPKYYFDHEAVQEEAIWKDDRRCGQGHIEYGGKREKTDKYIQRSFVGITEKRNKRDVWSVTTKAVKEAHFATFPEKLVEPCILAGSPVGGVVLDPFFGSGTTGIVANRLNRSYIGIELNEEYVDIAKKRNSDKQLTLAGII